MAARLLLGIEALALGALQGGASFCASPSRAPSPESDQVLADALGDRFAHVRDPAEAAAAVVDAAADGALGITVAYEADLPALLVEVDRAVRARAPALFVVLGARPGFAGELVASQAELAALRPRMDSPVQVVVPDSAEDCMAAAATGASVSSALRAPVVVYVDHVIAHTREPVEESRVRHAASFEIPPGLFGMFRARDAEVLVVACGSASRSAHTAVRVARERGVRAGFFGPMRVWPFPRRELAQAAHRSKAVLVVELNDGQLWETVAASVQASPSRPRVESLAEPRSGRIVPERVLAALEGLAA